jgi:hypothetical protein
MPGRSGITDIHETTRPISSAIRNAYIDFGKMTISLVMVVTNVQRAATGRIDPRTLCPAYHGGRPDIAA